MMNASLSNSSCIGSCYVFDTVEQLTTPGATNNEDRYFLSDSTVVVLDGATGLGESKVDANWFTSRLIDKFVSNIRNGSGLIDSINGAIVSIDAEYRETGADPNDIPPSAGGFFLQLCGDCLKYVYLGDCTMTIIGDDGTTEITGQSLRILDDKVIRAMRDIRKTQGLDIKDAVKTEQIVDMLRAHRRLMNNPDGYRIFAPFMPPLSQNDVHTVEADKVREIVLHSDGYDLIHDELVKGDIDIEKLTKDLRATEQADSALNEYPRFKVSDDATYVRLRIHKVNDSTSRRQRT